MSADRGILWQRTCIETNALNETVILCAALNEMMNGTKKRDIDLY